MGPEGHFGLEGGLEIPRTRLVEGVLRSRETAIAILAPAGYGKSVLARQIAATSEPAVTVDCSCVESDFNCLARAILTAAERRHHLHFNEVLLPAPGTGDLAIELEGFYERHQTSCIVLDNVQAGLNPTDVDELVACIRRANPAGRLVLTSRDQELGLGLCGETMVIGPSALRMRKEEASQLLQVATGQTVTDAMVGRAYKISHGQAAALRLIARSICIGSDAILEPPVETNIVRYLQHLAVQQLSQRQLRILYAVSLLVTGRAAELLPEFGMRLAEDVERISLCIPFVTISEPDSPASFVVHDLAASAYTQSDFIRDHVDDPAGLRAVVVDILDYRNDYERLFRVLLACGDSEALLRWAESDGKRLLENGSLTLLNEVTSRIGAASVLRSPRLLLLEAATLRETFEYREALKKATVARSIAEIEGDDGAVVEALLTMARLQMDLGWMGQAGESLEQVRRMSDTNCSAETRALVEAYLGLCLTCVGRIRDAAVAAERATAIVSDRQVPQEVLGRVTTSAAAATGVLSGRWDRVLDLCLRIQGLEDSSLGLRLQNKGNLGTVLCELGHMRRAEQTLEASLSELGHRGIEGLQHTFTTSLAAVKAGLGQYQIADALMESAIAGLDRFGDNLSIAHSLVFQSTWQRADGNLADSLATAERVVELCTSLACQWLEWQAHLEIGASLLALGDTVASARAAESLRSAALEVGALRHWLTADMILAEVARREGRLDEGIERLAEHEEYILTESANWQIAMYVRSFPHLLGMLALALGPEKLPVHLLRMVLPHDAQNTLGACAEILDDEMWRNLATRVVGETDVEHLERLRNTPLCHVRFFGGFQVRVGEREVLDKHWRKRKARLMFAMLAANQGTEIPREQLYELLWPEMDEPRARNNFYVIWGAMKAALAPEAEKSTPCPYAENTAGGCRVPRDLVTSDIDEFRLALSEAEEAGKTGKSVRAIRAYEQLADVYRGEFLPGDIYEDCFADIRDAFRVDFGDAMLRASELLDAEGDRIRALLMVRRGLKADPAREDLYQAAITLQIALGQRSAAIETYSACRKRLAEELGLDPSSDTLKLYEQVLAMEDGAEGEWGSGEESPEPPDGEAS